MALLVFVWAPANGVPAAASTVGGWDRVALVEPEGGFLDSLEALRFRGIPPEPRRVELHAELDSDPWPGTLEPGDGELVLRARAPLGPGEYRLRLFEELENGYIKERVDWTFEVGRPEDGVEEDPEARPRQASIAFDAYLDAGWRVDRQGGAGPEADAGQAEGASRLTAGLAAETWALDAETDWVYEPRTAELERLLGVDLGGDDPVDLETFLVSATMRGVALRAGDQPVGGARSLITEALHRRGVSVGLEAGGFELTGFAVAPEPVAGSSAGFGIDDPGHRVDGAQAVRRWSGRRSSVSVSAAYLSGEGALAAGVGVGGAASAGAGDAWELALDGELLDRRLSFRAGYAEARFDPDAEGGAAERPDEAFFLGLDLRSRVEAPVEGRLAWKLGLDRRRVGTFFRSLGNPSLAADEDALAGAAELAWRGCERDLWHRRFEVRLTAGTDDDNVSGLAALPRLRAETASASVTHSFCPAEGDEERSAMAWLRPRRWTASVDAAGLETRSAPAAGFAVDRLDRTVRLSLAGSAWSAGWVRHRLRDAARGGPPVVDERLDLSATFAGARSSLRALAQRSRLRGLGPGLDRTTTLARLGAHRELLERLSGEVALDVLWQEAADGERRTPTISGSLTWRVLTPTAARPGLAVWARGTWADDRGPLAVFSGARSQVFLGGRLSWWRRP